MRRILRRAAIAAPFVVVAAVVATPLSAGPRGHENVVLTDANGNEVGVAKLTQHKDNVVVRFVGNEEGLSPGFHGFHVHATGACVAPFTSAGGHYDTPGAGHGHGAHAGDMPPLLVNDDGTAEVRFDTDRFALGDLYDADGSALIVHAGPDNLANIPSRYSHATGTGPDATTLATGDAGARVACGVID
jgi:superoxide dismutase, Cu-Zn family